MSGDDTVCRSRSQIAKKAKSHLNFDQNIARASLDPRRIIVLENVQRLGGVAAEAVVNHCLVTFAVILMNAEGISGTGSPRRKLLVGLQDHIIHVLLDHTFNILLNNDVVPCIFNALERNRTLGRWLSSKCRRTRILIGANITGAVCRGSNE